ncbi:hypothetical protein ASPACDRAFT_1856718 [Aspergillus aculeatus ATCC 16872]|uniref:Uncharacterized protein n=1 Tax=Aspergillus aculeatus (strain ATCC 16872 / CBS 172.66 / WB 5094) TaxID=690307 RepID=A0A1L9WSN7_ASPA1|nr:uncharacterized protein ASPACDRAFT_1856718 [Aspergillus aculeatus ATCC 16872]OJJ99138.1 hypothetical protein ASPACDRAFT_1856718 [Aspergillus aculeatus ATCC 16872]
MSTFTHGPGDPMPTFRIPPPPMAASAFWSTPVIKDSLAITTRTQFVCKMEDTAQMWRRILAVRFDDWSLAVSPVNSPLTEPSESPELSDLSELDDDIDDESMSSGSDIPFRPPPGLLPYSVLPPPPPPPLFLFGTRNGILNRPTAGGLGMSIPPASVTQRGDSVNNASSSGSGIPCRATRSSFPYPPPLFVRQYLAAAREGTRVGPIRRSQTRSAANPETSRQPLKPYTLFDPSWDLGPPTQIPRQVLSALRSTASHEEDTSRSDASTQPEGPVHPHSPATGSSHSEESPACTTSRAPPIVVHELGTAIFSPDGTETDSNVPSLTSTSSPSTHEAPSDPYTSASPSLNSPSPPPTPPWKITDPALIPTYTLIQTKHDCRSVSMLPTEMLTLVMTRALPGHLPLPFLLLYCLPGLGYEKDEAAMIEWRDVKEHALHEISELVDRYTDLIPEDGERQRARTQLLADLHFGIATGSSVRMYDFDRGDDGVFLLEECAWAKQAGPRLNVRETPIAFSNLVDRIAGWEN